MPRLMLNCKDYAQLVSGCLDREPTLWDRLAIKLHQWLCPPCTDIEDQFKAIRQVCRWSGTEDSEAGRDKPSDHALSSEAKDRIKAALRESEL